MKKKIIYFITTTLILGFSIDNNAYAEKTNNYNNEVVKLQLNNNSSFYDFSTKNTVHNLNNNSHISNNSDFNPAFMNFIIPGFTQFYYGEPLKGFLFLLGTLLSPIWISPLINVANTLQGVATGSLGTAGNAFAGIWVIFIPPIIYIWSLIDANTMVYERSKLSKSSVKNENLFDVALFSKDF